MKILGVDPGSAKTGLAIVNQNREIFWRQIIAPEQLGIHLNAILQTQRLEIIALGDSTASQRAKIQIEAVLRSQNSPAALQIVDEYGSTLEARALYWHAKPPRGWKRLIPLSLQVPNESIDDFAAAVIALRALNTR